MKKVSKVIFVQEETNPKIMDNRVKVDAPIPKGKIDLPSKPKKEETKREGNENGLRPIFWENFQIADWKIYIDCVYSAQKALGGMFVTISKKAYKNGLINENFGSVWYSCGSKEFKDHFRRPLVQKLAEKGLKRITKSDIRQMKSGSEFTIIFISEFLDVEILNVVKCDEQGDEKAIVYKYPGEIEKYEILYEDIREDGSGSGISPENEKEDYYFYVKA